MKRAPRRERGVVLVSFAIILSAVLLVAVMGWISVMSKGMYLQREKRTQDFIGIVQKQLDGYLAVYANTLANPTATVDSTTVRRDASLPDKFQLEVEVSDPLRSGDFYYRVIVAYLPTDTDSSNGPNLASFRTTGVFQSCANLGAPCATRKLVVVSSLKQQQEAFAVTQARLKNLALRAQLYFKQRVLGDPERRITVNYFRPTSGSCDVAYLGTRDLPCMNAETTLDAPEVVQFVKLLGLSEEDLVDGWGNTIKAINGPDGTGGSANTPETLVPPFSMLFRTVTATGTQIQTVATQSLQ